MVLDLISPLASAALTLYQISQDVRENCEECAAIRDTVSTLVAALQSGPRTEFVSVSMEMRLKNITKVLEEVNTTMKALSNKSFLHKIMHRRGVKSKLKGARQALQDAAAVFQLGAQEEILVVVQELRYRVQGISEAQHKDEQIAEAACKDMLKKPDIEIIETLGVEDKFMQEAMVALSKHIDQIPDGPEKQCCERGLDAMRRRSGDLPIEVDRFAISSYEVSIHYEKTKLGSGGFAKVFQGTYREEAVAVKVLTETAHWSILQREVDVWKQLSHPNILKFIGACSIAEPPFMVSQLKPNGDVLTYLHKKPNASRLKILYEASLGLEYLHDLLVVHGDLKATNILIDENGVACLADFGLSRIKSHATVTAVFTTGARPRQGTMRWMAPEQLRGSEPSRSSDIYSFAMTIYETFTGRPPFPSSNIPDTVLFTMICNAERPLWDDVKPEVRALGLNESLWEVVSTCWAHEPQTRWKAKELSERLKELLTAATRPSRQATLRPAIAAVHKAQSALPLLRSSKPGGFLQQDSPRPAPPLRLDSAPALTASPAPYEMMYGHSSSSMPSVPSVGSTVASISHGSSPPSLIHSDHTVDSTMTGTSNSLGPVTPQGGYMDLSMPMTRSTLSAASCAEHRSSLALETMDTSWNPWAEDAPDTRRLSDAVKPLSPTSLKQFMPSMSPNQPSTPLSTPSPWQLDHPTSTVPVDATDHRPTGTGALRLAPNCGDSPATPNASNVSPSPPPHLPSMYNSLIDISEDHTIPATPGLVADDGSLSRTLSAYSKSTLSPPTPADGDRQFFTGANIHEPIPAPSNRAQKSPYVPPASHDTAVNRQSHQRWDSTSTTSSVSTQGSSQSEALDLLSELHLDAPLKPLPWMPLAPEQKTPLLGMQARVVLPAEAGVWAGWDSLVFSEDDETSVS